MPSDYTTAGGGLKLKGPSGVVKKKKKKRPAPAEHREPSTTADISKRTTDPDAARSLSPVSTTQAQAQAQSLESSTATSTAATTTSTTTTSKGGKKTDAEKRHEAYRRKRLEDKMGREGGRTHKQRVEELNRYLSGLSEHHDMPKIGPG